MANTRDIQRRIKSVGNTKKITKAMEMVAAAKMRRAIEAVLKTRTYANLSWTTILHLSRCANSDSDGLHPLLSKRNNPKKIGIILISSNRGLCGGFNTTVINKAHESVKKHQAEKKIDTDFILIGKKGALAHKYFGYNIAAEFPKVDIISEIKEVYPISKFVIDDFLSGEYDKIMVAYTDYVNAAKQIPRIKQLLPVDISAEDEYLGVVGKDERVGLSKDFIKEKEKKYLSDDKFSYEYIFEPNPREVLDEMIPRLIEVQLFQALLESNASEHSARMTAMHQATDAASDMVSELTLFYNKARQASITSEIAEISAGANALADN
ncbi:MAG: ATP synthase F1 subunit gamma [Patescibacteria group bacterium]|nr:ATP synthase F1 subunit gamma [Patescibacteria group bacterium]